MQLEVKEYSIINLLEDGYFVLVGRIKLMIRKISKSDNHYTFIQNESVLPSIRRSYDSLHFILNEFFCAREVCCNRKFMKITERKDLVMLVLQWNGHPQLSAVYCFFASSFFACLASLASFCFACNSLSFSFLNAVCLAATAL